MSQLYVSFVSVNIHEGLMILILKQILILYSLSSGIQTSTNLQAGLGCVCLGGYNYLQTRQTSK